LNVELLEDHCFQVSFSCPLVLRLLILCLKNLLQSCSISSCCMSLTDVGKIIILPDVVPRPVNLDLMHCLFSPCRFCTMLMISRKEKPSDSRCETVMNDKGFQASFSEYYSLTNYMSETSNSCKPTMQTDCRASSFLQHTLSELLCLGLAPSIFLCFQLDRISVTSIA
jgi:hypothetical protein